MITVLVLVFPFALMAMMLLMAAIETSLSRPVAATGRPTVRALTGPRIIPADYHAADEAPVDRAQHDHALHDHALHGLDALPSQAPLHDLVAAEDVDTTAAGNVVALRTAV